MLMLSDLQLEPIAWGASNVFFLDPFVSVSTMGHVHEWINKCIPSSPAVIYSDKMSDLSIPTCRNLMHVPEKNLDYM